VTLVGEPSSADTSAEVCELPLDLSADDIEMLKELEECIRVSGMDSQDPCGHPEGVLFCIRCRKCRYCRRCIACRWI
jgi:hypothetical protein